MNIRAFFFAAALVAASAPLSPAAPLGKPAAATQPAGAERDGLIFTQYPYTILTVRACSTKNSEEGIYDHTVILRFRNDNKRRLDIKVLAPGETKAEWDPRDEFTTYQSNGSHYANEGSDISNELELNIKNFSETTAGKDGMPECRVKLKESAYTYILSGRKWIDTYTFAPDARVRASKE